MFKVFFLMLFMILSSETFGMVLVDPIAKKRRLERDLSTVSNEYMSCANELKLETKMRIEKMSQIMFQIGLTAEWQSRYFVLRAKESAKRGHRLLEEIFIEYSRRLQQSNKSK